MFIKRTTKKSNGKTYVNHLLVESVITEKVLPASNGKTLKIRKGSAPEETHRQIYDTLGFPHEVMKPVRTWCANSH